jgi:restriction endonuclease S subunit
MLQAFTTWSDEITERLDPFYYSSDIKSFRQKLENLNSARLSDIIDGITKGETPLWRGDSYTDEGIPFLKAQNINPDGIIGEIAYIPPSVDSRMSRSQLHGGELLYTMAGTVGVATLFPTNYGRANINQAIAKITVKNDVDKEYLVIILNSDICKTQAKILVTAVAQPNINFEQIKSIRIPYMDEDTRNKIIQVYRESKKLIQYKKQKAQELLNGIDTYILNKLGISIDKTANSTTFTVWSDEIEGRIDSPYYNLIYTNLAKQLDAKDNIIPFDNIIEDLSGGATPIVTGDYYTDKGGIPFLRVQNITEHGILLEDVKYIKPEVHEGLLRRSQLRKDDLVFTITGRIGSVAVCPDNFVGNINQHSVRIKLKDKYKGVAVNPHYIAVYFNSSVGRKVSFREITGGTRPALDYKALRSLWVVLPSKEIQNEIVEEVNRRKREARAFLDEVNTSLEETKNKIEQMILGA